MAKRLKNPSSSRSVTEVGAGDFVKVGSQWKRIASNPAHGQARPPKSWDVTTDDGVKHGMFGINRYAKADDLD